MVHGDCDEVAPISETCRFVTGFRIDLIEICGADHGFSDPVAMQQVIDYAMVFFDFDDRTPSL